MFISNDIQFGNFKCMKNLLLLQFQKVVFYYKLCIVINRKLTSRPFDRIDRHYLKSIG